MIKISSAGWAQGNARLLAVVTEHPLVVRDTHADPVWARNVNVVEGGIRAYAGVPLFDRDGLPLGTLCVARIADVVYLGKAGSVAGRVGELLRFANGEPVGHWGGRLLWQVDLPYVLAWKETPDQNPRLVEKGFLRDFSTHHGRLPFANLCH